MVENSTERSKEVVYVDGDFTVYDSASDLAEARKEQERIERENKNKPFIQITKGVAPNILRKMSKSAIDVFMFLLDNMDMQDVNIIAVSQQTIADELEISRQSVMRGVKELETLKAIAIGKVGNSNVYLVNPEIAWANSARRKHSMLMRGNILLGEKENQELFKQFDEIEKKSLKVQKANIPQVKKS